MLWWIWVFEDFAKNYKTLTKVLGIKNLVLPRNCQLFKKIVENCDFCQNYEKASLKKAEKFKIAAAIKVERSVKNFKSIKNFQNS